MARRKSISCQQRLQGQFPRCDAQFQSFLSIVTIVCHNLSIHYTYINILHYIIVVIYYTLVTIIWNTIIIHLKIYNLFIIIIILHSLFLELAYGWSYRGRMPSTWLPETARGSNLRTLERKEMQRGRHRLAQRGLFWEVSIGCNPTDLLPSLTTIGDLTSLFGYVCACFHEFYLVQPGPDLLRVFLLMHCQG